MGRTQFNLLRWFAVISFICIAALSSIGAILLSQLVRDRMIANDALATMQFVQSVMAAENAPHYFEDPAGTPREDLEEVFYHLAEMPDVRRANVYGADRRVIWSSSPQISGRVFSHNAELAEALRGRLVFAVRDGSGHEHKAEHQALRADATYVESYVPIFNEARNRVVGVVELYEEPVAVLEGAREARLWIWTGAVTGGLLLYGALFWLVRRGDNLIRRQHEQLAETQMLAMVGEMGTAVAHGLRNPLAAIRSSAELALATEGETVRETATDIMREVDRLEGWIRRLLSFSQPEDGKPESLDLASVVSESLDTFAREMTRRGVRVTARVPDDLPRVRANRMLIGQVINSLIANSLEAMRGAGEIEVVGRASEDGRQVELSIRDTGPGMLAEDAARAFRPFHTTKAKGLGVGLPLARRIVERFGGRIALSSAVDRGTTVVVEFPRGE